MEMAGKSGMVSVLIPVFNREAVLAECVDSVYAQSYQNFEILLIDDGSTDNSLNICKTLAEKDPRIKMLASGHLGVSGARNLGLEAAEGEYVFFLDSDDIIHPRLLEVLVDNAKKHGAKIAGTKCRSCRQESWEKGRNWLYGDETPAACAYQDHAETLRALFYGNSPVNMIGGVMMRRDWIGQTRFHTELFIGEDFYFIYENLVKGADAVFLDQSWYLNRIHGGNTSWQYGFDGFWTRFYRRELVWKREETFGRTEYVNIQKRDAFGCYTRCVEKNKPCSTDARKMQAVMKQYRKEILPALRWKTKVWFLLYVYFPATAMALRNIKRRICKRNNT